MPTEYRWEYVKSIKAHDDDGNAYQIDQEQWVGTLSPISGPNSVQTRSTGGKIRFTCDGNPVNQLSNGQYKLVTGIILTPDSLGT